MNARRHGSWWVTNTTAYTLLLRLLLQGSLVKNLFHSPEVLLNIYVYASLLGGRSQPAISPQGGQNLNRKLSLLSPKRDSCVKTMIKALKLGRCPKPGQSIRRGNPVFGFEPQGSCSHLLGEVLQAENSPSDAQSPGPRTFEHSQVWSQTPQDLGWEVSWCQVNVFHMSFCRIS